jgi:hypothetical protein
MSISSSILNAFLSLQKQLVAAGPLLSASYPTRTALKLNAANLVASVQSALTSDTLLDTWTAPSDPPSMVAGVQTVISDAQDVSNLSVMRGVLGRVASNLDQLP